MNMCETEGVFERLHKMENKNQDVNNMENRNEKKKNRREIQSRKKGFENKCLRIKAGIDTWEEEEISGAARMRIHRGRLSVSGGGKLGVALPWEPISPPSLLVGLHHF